MLVIQNRHNTQFLSKTKRPLVRFQLSQHPQVITAKDDDFMDEIDSGAPSPEPASTQSLQPASTRLLYTQQRISLLKNIEECLAIRAEYESAKSSFVRLHEEVKSRLRNRVRQIKTDKNAQLSQARRTCQALGEEREALMAQKTRLLHHIEEHERQHQHHQNKDSPPDPNMSNNRSISDRAPSKKADQRLAAGRLLKEVLQLRTRLLTLERKLEQENRRKVQAEEELAILKAAISRHRKR